MSEAPRCITCGFLAQRAEWGYGSGPVRGFFEVLPETRQDPKEAALLILPTVPRSQYNADVVCYRRAACFPQPVAVHAALRQNPAQALRTLSEDRACDEWMEYEPGLSPHDHHLDLKARQLEQDRKNFQLRMAEMEQRLRDERDEVRDEREKSEHRLDRRLTKAAIWFAVILGIARIIAALVASTPDSLVYRFVWPPKVSPAPILWE